MSAVLDPRADDQTRTIYEKSVAGRRAFTAPEIKVMRGIISSLDRFSRKHPRGAGNPDDFDD